MNVDSIFSIPEDTYSDFGEIDSLDVSRGHCHLHPICLNWEMFDEVTVVESFEIAFEDEVAFADPDFDGFFTKFFDMLLAVMISKIHRPDILLARLDRLHKGVSALPDKIVKTSVECFKMIDTG